MNSPGSDLTIGRRVRVFNSVGIIRFRGRTHIADGEWVGVELDYPVGDNDGEIDNVRYFICPFKHGVFIRPNQVHTFNDPDLLNDQPENEYHYREALFREISEAEKITNFNDGNYVEGSANYLNLTPSIRLWAFGENNFGQLGLGHQRPFSLLPSLITSFNDYDDGSTVVLLSIALGGAYSVALIAHNKSLCLMTTGSSPIQSNLTDAKCDRLMFQPINIANADMLTAVAASEKICAVCFRNGSIMVAGEWSGEISGVGPIQRLQCSTEHVVVCSSDGHVTVISCDLRKTPVLFSESIKIVDISCRSTSCMALSDSGSVWTWKIEQLNGVNIIPQPIGTMPKCKRIACGNQHYLALSNDGNIYSWGSGTSGCLGTGSYSDESNPVLLSSITQPVIDIAAGANHSVCLTAEGSVYTWGDGTLGQLGHGDVSCFPFPRSVLSLENKGIHFIVAGPNQTLAYANKSAGTDEIPIQSGSSSVDFPQFDSGLDVAPFDMCSSFISKDFTVDNNCNKTDVEHRVCLFNSRPYDLVVIHCQRMQLAHLWIHFEVDLGVSFRGAVNCYIRSCFESKSSERSFLFKNLSASKQKNHDDSKLRLTLLIICKSDMLFEGSNEEIPDFISLFIESFFPLTVNPKFVVIRPVSII